MFKRFLLPTPLSLRAGPGSPSFLASSVHDALPAQTKPFG